eukprot:scaffold32294_cov25-Prasinocladus_malaysianus.AAC.1
MASLPELDALSAPFLPLFDAFVCASLPSCGGSDPDPALSASASGAGDLPWPEGFGPVALLPVSVGRHIC